MKQLLTINPVAVTRKGVPDSQNSLEEWSRLCSHANWNDWHWQSRHAFKDPADVIGILRAHGFDVQLPARIEPILKAFPFRITPYQVRALLISTPELRPSAVRTFCRAFLPSIEESARNVENPQRDGIGETKKKANPVEAISKFYNDRALFRVTRMCPAYCRYCFRKRMVGDASPWNRSEIDEGLKYLRRDRDIREVVLSGGDPLSLGNEKIGFLLHRLDEIPHIRAVRFDTRALTVLPQRIDGGLCELFAQTRLPLFLISHVSHPYEITDEVRSAVKDLMRAGVTVHAHVPLLREINDRIETLETLLNELVYAHILPYYLIHFIPTMWTEHFRVPLEEGLKLKDHLNRKSTGLANPQYIVYLPDAGGKVPLQPDYIKNRTADGFEIVGNDGSVYLYKEPQQT